jgi:TPR repeat protein
MEPDDALLIGDLDLVLRILRIELKSISEYQELEPRLLLALSKLHQSIGDEELALVLFRKAAEYKDQNRGYYSDVGFCSAELFRASASEEFRAGVKEAIQELLKVSPFRDDLRQALGADYY